MALSSPNRQPRKLGRLTPLVFAFSVADADEHAKVLRRLQDELDDVPAFVLCLAALARLETEFKCVGKVFGRCTMIEL